jgi:hypothetical protein
MPAPIPTPIAYWGGRGLRKFGISSDAFDVIVHAFYFYHPKAVAGCASDGFFLRASVSDYVSTMPYLMLCLKTVFRFFKNLIRK